MSMITPQSTTQGSIASTWMTLVMSVMKCKRKSVFVVASCLVVASYRLTTAYIMFIVFD